MDALTRLVSSVWRLVAALVVVFGATALLKLLDIAVPGWLVLIVALFVLLCWHPSNIVDAIAKRGGRLFAGPTGIEATVAQPSAPEASEREQEGKMAEPPEEPGTPSALPEVGGPAQAGGPWQQAFQAYVANDFQRADELVGQAYTAEQDDDERLLLGCIRQQWRAEAGYGQPIMELEALADKHPQSPVPLVVLANVYSARAEHQRAASLLLRAAPLAENAEDAVEYRLRAAEELAKARLFDQAEAELRDLLTAHEANVVQARICRAFGHLEQERGRKSRMFEWYERSLELNPTDSALRFTTAYEYSEDGNDIMALFHYKQIEHIASNEGVLNNLGITFERLGMRARCVSAYRRSWEKGSSLALGNMANLLVSQGFLEEASKLLAEADAGVSDPDKRVAEVRSRIGSIPGQEEATEKDKLQAASAERRLRLDMLDGRSGQTPNIGGRWTSTFGTLDLGQSPGLVIGTEVGAWPYFLIGWLEGRMLYFRWSRGQKGESMYQAGEGEVLIDASGRSARGSTSTTEGWQHPRRSPFEATKVSDEIPAESPLVGLLSMSKEETDSVPT